MANRKTRRKEKKSNNRKVVLTTPDESMPNLMKIGTIVVIIFIVFYILTLSLTGNIENDNTADNDTKTPATIQYEEILAGETFNMKNTEYYVLFYDFSDRSINTLYGGIINSFKTNHTSTKLYIVDLSKAFSTPYIADVSNSSVQKIEDLKIKGPTVIKINNGQNIAYAEGKDAISNMLK